VFRCGKIRLCCLALPELFECQPGRLKHVVTVNAEIFALAHESPRFQTLLASTVNTIDGRVLEWTCRWLYRGLGVTRLAGSDFIFDLAAHCAAATERLFLLGSSARSNQLATQALRRRLPSLQVAGFAPPFSSDIGNRDWNASMLERIALFCPHHLVVCFGPPKQEYWIAMNSRALSQSGVSCAYGLGGTIDFVAGTRRRAPKPMQVAGLEWFFRFLCEPRQRFWRTARMFKMPYYAALTRREVASGTMDGRRQAFGEIASVG
jgi:N-acetylglucosaminyldiphosphoundecaprenol N-acetyl-beta-D-mannosaminyltransferase